MISEWWFSADLVQLVVFERLILANDLPLMFLNCNFALMVFDWCFLVDGVEKIDLDWQFSFDWLDWTGGFTARFGLTVLDWLFSWLYSNYKYGLMVLEWWFWTEGYKLVVLKWWFSTEGFSLMDYYYMTDDFDWCFWLMFFTVCFWLIIFDKWFWTDWFGPMVSNWWISNELFDRCFLLLNFNWLF